MYLARKYELGELPTHFRDLAFAYLEASERLCDDLESRKWPGDYHKGQVTMLLAFHSTELFLKGCIQSVSGRKVKNLHSLGELLEEFSTLYPSVQFEPPFGSEPVPADPELIEWVIETDKRLHEQLRYPTDRSGKQWDGIRAFSPASFKSQLAKLRQDFERISNEVFAK